MLSLLFASILALVSLVPRAEATSYSLEPQNRFHGGLSVVDTPSPFGVTVGLDSRLTRILAMDVGLFVSPFPLPEGESTVAAENYAQNFRLRHGLYLAPGIRIPHPQPKTWAWEVFIRPGAGALWVLNLDPNVIDSASAVRPAAGGSLGADAFVRFGQFGIRAYGRGWIFSGIRVSPDQNYVLVRPHYGLEAMVQW